MSEKATYTHGHHKSVVTSHARRTIHDSAAFLLPHIKSTDHILDLGCGPGSITVGFASLVPLGRVVGGDSVSSVLTQAETLASSLNLSNMSFQTMDGNALPFPDNTFDISYCHQVLQHVGDPVAILQEMRRVTKPGGLVAARDADYKTFAWWPEFEGMALWGDLYQKLGKANGAEPNAGRYLPQWARDAGFATADVAFTWDIWNYQGKALRDFAGNWVDRALHSTFAEGAVRKGFATREDLVKVSDAWKRLSETESAFIIIPNGEILCTVR